RRTGWDAARFRGSRCVAGRLSMCLFKDTHDLGFEFREFHGEHHAARMEDEIAASGKKIDVAAQDLAHAALDAVTIMSFAQHLAGSKPDAGRCRLTAIHLCLWCEEPAHGCGLTLTRRGVGALVVGVPAQTHTCDRLALSRLGMKAHREG